MGFFQFIFSIIKVFSKLFIALVVFFANCSALHGDESSSCHNSCHAKAIIEINVLYLLDF